MKTFLAGAIAILAALQSLRADETATLKKEKLVTGRIWMRSYDFEAAEKKMEYGLFVPEGYDEEKSYPLMVALHGLHSTPRQILGYPGFTKLAQKHGYILAAPMGYNRKGWYGGRGETSRRWEPENLGELSEKDVMNVLEIVRDEFNIDEKQIYLMGHSMGGGGTWHLGIKYPEIWAGLAPIAPATFRSPDDLEKIKTTPVILVQGDKDRLVPVKGAQRWAAKMEELEMTHKYIEVEGGNHIMPAITQLPEIFDFFAKHKKEVEANEEADTPK
ncbi:MAG: alpha/beta hydrolase [Planctomycetota bacterium]